MWCKSCGQDVPGIAAVGGEQIACARCGTAFEPSDATNPARVARAAAHGVELKGPRKALPGGPSFEDWQIEQNVRQLRSKVSSWQAASRQAQAPPAAPHSPVIRVDAAHRRMREPHKPRTPSTSRGNGLTWSLLALGLMTFACGAVLLGWSFASGRGELWSLGMPIVIAGQVGLLLGLVLQLERIGQTSRYTVKKLNDVKEQLLELERASRMLSVTHSSASQAFYSHMAEEANPQLLLADLKGQIDLLAASLSKRSA